MNLKEISIQKQVSRPGSAQEISAFGQYLLYGIEQILAGNEKTTPCFQFEFREICYCVERDSGGIVTRETLSFKAYLDRIPDDRTSERVQSLEELDLPRLDEEDFDADISIVADVILFQLCW